MPDHEQAAEADPLVGVHDYFAFPSTDGLQGLRGACLARDRFSLSRVMLRGVTTHLK